MHFVHARSFVVAESSGFDRLFGLWGGEIIYWQGSGSGSQSAALEAIEVLTAASVPTLVVGRLPIERIRNGYDWATTVVGAHGRLEGGPSMWTAGELPVERLIQPGDSDWDGRWLAC